MRRTALLCLPLLFLAACGSTEPTQPTAGSSSPASSVESTSEVPAATTEAPDVYAIAAAATEDAQAALEEGLDNPAAFSLVVDTAEVTYTGALDEGPGGTTVTGQEMLRLSGLAICIAQNQGRSTEEIANGILSQGNVATIEEAAVVVGAATGAYCIPFSAAAAPELEEGDFSCSQGDNGVPVCEGNVPESVGDYELPDGTFVENG